MNIQWYPGHMTKTRRQMEADLKHVDIVVEIVDARVPISSRNPDIDAICGNKPRVIMLNRADQADPQLTRAWADYFNKTLGIPAAAADSRAGTGVGQMAALARSALKEQIARWKEKGQVGRPIRAMVVGVPNVGKSTFIKQWVSVDSGLELLDTPGILWPKFEDETTGLHLAFTGAVKDEVTDLEGLACALLELLRDRYPQAVKERYKVAELEGRQGWELLEDCAKNRGMRISGGEVDTERMAKLLLDEFRGGKLGRFTLEAPEDVKR